jgi:amino acid adenylation domain-containing protein
MQQGMLYHGLTAEATQGEPVSLRAPSLAGLDIPPGVDVNQLVCTPDEDLDVAALREAFARVIARHPILRTAFRWRDLDEPMQDVYREARIPVEEQDARSLPEPEREAAFMALLEADRRRGFDLTRPPLMRLTLFRVADRRYKILWTFHHVYLDGRSFYTVLTEVFAFYDAIREGRTLDLPSPRPFRDYIEWVAEKDWSSAQAFWRELLEGFTAKTPIPIDRTAPPERGRTINEMALRRHVPADLTARLRAQASANGATLNTVVQVAWAILLGRYSGQRDVVFGATRACRKGAIEGTDSMVGLLINTLPVRLRTAPESTVLDAIKDLRAQWIAMRDHEHTPLAHVTRWSEVRGARSLFDSIIVAENYNWKDALRAEGEAWKKREVEIFERTNYPLALIVDLGREIELLVHYDGRRFAKAAVERMLGHLSVVFEAIAQGFESRIDDLPILTPEEREALSAGGAGASAAGATHEDASAACIHHLIEAQAARTPDAVAVEDAGQTLSYMEFEERANKLANYLHSIGVRPGDPVGICETRSLDLAVGLYGILKAGGAYVPLDPAYPRERLSLMVKDAELKVVLTRRALAAMLVDVGHVEHAGTKLCLLDEERELIERASPERPRADITPEDTAYIIYTSGSTGAPKGVLTPHRALVNHAVTSAASLEIGPGDRMAQFSSISFDGAVLEIFPAWTRGAAVVLRPDDAVEPRQLEHWIARARITGMFLTTAFWHEWVSAIEASGGSPPASLRLLIVGGEKASRAAFDAWERISAGRVRWINIYGPTETTVYVTYCDPSREPPLPPGMDVPIGRSIRGARLHVLDDRLRPVPLGVPGELYVGGLGVAKGYLKRPELTAERFIESPFVPGDRLYKTGDRVRFLEDGQLQFLGRVDRQVKLRGFRIELQEIESVLARHPDVRASAVVVAEPTPGDRRLVAYASGTSALTSDALRRYLKATLPPYMIPSTFVIADALPMTPNGKVDRDALPSPEEGRKEERALVAPRTFTEELLAGIFCDVLEIPKVSVLDSFFDLGGHSLLMLRIIDRASHAGLRITAAQLFQHPSVAELAAVVSTSVASPGSPGRKAEPWSSLVPLRTTGKRPPLFLVHTTPGDIFCYARLVTELGPDQPCYGFQSRGLYKLEESHRSIEEMAASYVELMRETQKEGPYFIGGWCYGGIVATEMAQQLRRAGDRAALVAVMDAMAPKPTSLLHPYYADRLRSFLAMGLRGQARYIRDKLDIYRGDGARSLTDMLEVEVSDGPLANRAQVSDTNLKAFRDYRVERYPGKLTLFRATEVLKGAVPDRFLGWSSLAESLDVFEIPTSHASILHDPHVKVLARYLKQAMDRAGAATMGTGTASRSIPPQPPSFRSVTLSARGLGAGVALHT